MFAPDGRTLFVRAQRRPDLSRTAGISMRTIVRPERNERSSPRPTSRPPTIRCRPMDRQSGSPPRRRDTTYLFTVSERGRCAFPRRRQCRFGIGASSAGQFLRDLPRNRHSPRRPEIFRVSADGKPEHRADPRECVVAEGRVVFRAGEPHRDERDGPEGWYWLMKPPQFDPSRKSPFPMESSNSNSDYMLLFAGPIAPGPLPRRSAKGDDRMDGLVRALGQRRQTGLRTSAGERGSGSIREKGAGGR